MNRVCSIFSLGSLLVLSLGWFVSHSPAQTRISTTRISIELKNHATASGEIIRLGDVATIRSSNVKLNRQLAQIDLDEWPQGRYLVNLTRRQIATRLQLSDLLAGRSYSVSGALSITVTRKGSLQPSTQITPIGETDDISHDLQVAIRQALAKRHAVELTNVIVELDKVHTIDRAQFQNQVRYKVLDPDKHRLGRHGMNIGILDGDQFVEKRWVTMDSSVIKRVAVCSQPISYGELLTTQNVTLEERHFSDTSIDTAMGVEVFGRKARRTLRRAHAIKVSDVAVPKSASRSQEEVLIRANDVVSVVAGEGSVQVTLRGGARAMQSGKKGDIITVRNQRTKRDITARIVSATVVRAVY